MYASISCFSIPFYPLKTQKDWFLKKEMLSIVDLEGKTMPRSSKKQIKDDEKKVIRELEKNSKENIDTIGKNCGFSRQKVWRIVKRLEKNKTIWGYTTIADADNQDLTQYTVLIKRTSLPLTEKLANTIVVRKIEDLVPTTKVRIESSYYAHGEYDWIITFTAENIQQAKKFCETLNKIYQGHIKELHLLETMFSIRKQGILNPEAQKLKEFL